MSFDCYGTLIDWTAGMLAQTQAQLLRALRDPSLLTGRCELRAVCGGSRAQAWARTGDPLGENPSCSYEPAAAVRAWHGDGTPA